MVNQQLTDYIKQSRDAGIDDNTLKRTLLGSGYTIHDIEEAISGTGAERNVLENMQNQRPMFPGNISEERPAGVLSKLVRVVKIFVIILLVLVGIIGGYFALANYFPQYAKYVQPYLGPVLDYMRMNTPEPDFVPILTPTQTFVPVPTVDPIMVDSDSDGLTNIDEAKYGTDPSKADTDGDGYPDGEEVQNGYNPLGPGRASPPPSPTKVY